MRGLLLAYVAQAQAKAWGEAKAREKQAFDCIWGAFVARGTCGSCGCAKCGCTGIESVVGLGRWSTVLDGATGSHCPSAIRLACDGIWDAGSQKVDRKL